jgi:hypothetical protein
VTQHIVVMTVVVMTTAAARCLYSAGISLSWRSLPVVPYLLGRVTAFSAATRLALPACLKGVYARRSVPLGPPKAGPDGWAVERVGVRGPLRRLRLEAQTRGDAPSPGPKRDCLRLRTKVGRGRGQTARALIALKLGCLAVVVSLALPAFAWEYWGGDRGGTRFSAVRQITPANVGSLVRAWEFRTGDLARRDPKTMALTKFEDTPLFVEDRLILCTPFNEVIALDPGAGTVQWRFDPKVSIERPANRYNCRGVAYWVDDQASPGPIVARASSWAPTTCG